MGEETAQGLSSIVPNRKRKRRRHAVVSASSPTQSHVKRTRHDHQSSTLPEPSLSHDEKRLNDRQVNVNDLSGMAALDELKYVTSTGSTLTAQSAGHVLSRYINSYGKDPSVFRQETTYEIVPMPGPPKRKKKPMNQGAPQHLNQPPPDSLFRCTLSLPPGCPLKSMSSPAHRSKDSAKKHVSFELVKTLINMGEVDQNLQPKPRSVVPKESRKDARYDRIAAAIESRLASPLGSPAPEDGRTSKDRIHNFKEAVNNGLPPQKLRSNGMPGTDEYEHLTDAAFWTSCPPFSCDNIHATFFKTILESPFDAVNSTCRTMCFLTTKPLPILPEGGSRYIDIGMPKVGREGISVDANVQLRKGGLLEIKDSAMLETMRRYTERLVRSHVHKNVHLDLTMAKWLFIPLKLDAAPALISDSVDPTILDWDEVIRGAESNWTPLTCYDPHDLAAEMSDSLTTTHVEFTKRSAIRAIRSDLTPSTPLPGGNGETALSEQIVAPPPLEYPDQPLLEVEALHPCKMGGIVASVAFPPQIKFLIPELTAKHCISASVSRATSVIPAFMNALDNLMIAQQLAEGPFERLIDLDLALTALSAPMSHGLAPEKSYQRLEFLGDVILKLLTAVYLLQTVPDTGPEWETLHAERQVMGSNRRLYDRAVQSGIPPYIRTSRIRAKDWVPSGWTVIRLPAEKPARSEEKHTLGDKTVADVVEALIGAAHESAPAHQRLDRCIHVAHKMKLEMPGFSRWSDLRALDSASFRSSLPSVPLIVMGHAFRTPQRGRDALSMSHDRTRRSAFQRYKTIGDAILDYFIVEDLFHRNTTLLSGSLSNMRHSRHGDSCLAALAASSGLLDLLTDVPMDVLPNLQDFKRNIRRGQRIADQKPEPKERWEFWKEIPSQHYLGEVVNALLGAILLDANWNVLVVRAVYETHIMPFLDRYCIGPNDHFWHPKVALNELLAARGCRKWAIEDIGRKFDVDPCEVIVTMHGQRISQGLAETPVIATRKACDVAVKRLQAEKLSETLCDCPKRKKSTSKLA
ncbi:hypothetical protein BD324DRAFT_629595 [Kockovaella imperatae]|uniref:Uncharacterized protein n=1 Tax=Kockovaella imperatae TaxID=4999 RepID=A0A1Y1UEK7_9TREE|nr:hypothetical protein BD324DRAFT_629595 [Kockovaella imperatae]ORX35944.1 hypothetical protein BD324DRAFT_629595 [Kockovaella imperatae]